MTWIVLGIIAAILLIVFWRRRNAIWGGLTLGIIIGLIVAVFFVFEGSGFDGYIVGKGAILGIIIGFMAQLLGRVPDLLKGMFGTDSNDAMAHYNLGLAYNKKEMYNEEIAEYKKAIQINPDFAEAHHNLGTCYVHKGMLDEAMAEFTNALEINPNLAEAHNSLGAGCYHKGEYSLAIEHCDMAIRLGYRVRSELLEALEPYREK